MNVDEIREYIEQNSDEPAVQQLVDSLADKRVNQAREKWERELPERVDTEIAKREEREQQRQQRRAQVSEQLGDRFAEEKIDPDWATPFLPEDLADVEDEQVPEVAEHVIGQVRDMREKLLSEKYTGKPPAGGSDSSGTDPSVREFRKAMGLGN